MLAAWKLQRPALPRIFRYMSMVGSLLLLSCFTFGKTNSAGILSNLFPLGIAVCNLFLDFKKRTRLPSLFSSSKVNLPPDVNRRKVREVNCCPATNLRALFSFQPSISRYTVANALAAND
jgi:hypothetical protein